MEETWRDVPGYEGLYEASDLGHIRITSGRVTENRRFPKRTWKQRIINGRCDNTRKRRDRHVCLWKDGQKKELYVSRIIAMTFCQGYFPGATVNHKNGDPTDNRAENLEWMTVTDNIRHGYEHGLMHQSEIVLTDGYGYTLRFRSMSQTDRYLQRSPGYTSHRFRKGMKTVESRDREIFYAEIAERR